jgi:hypothetical protein
MAYTSCVLTFVPVPVSAGCEYTILVLGRFFLALGVDVDSDVDTVVGAGAGVEPELAEELSGAGCECHDV